MREVRVFLATGATVIAVLAVVWTVHLGWSARAEERANLERRQGRLMLVSAAALVLPPVVRLATGATGWPVRLTVAAWLAATGAIAVGLVWLRRRAPRHGERGTGKPLLS